MTIIEIITRAIRSQVCKEEIAPFGVISDNDMRSLYQLSKSHDIDHIVAAELDRQGLLKDGDEISEKFKKSHFVSVFRFERINFELESISDTLKTAEIPFIPLKGSVLRKYYPEPWMRTSCDIDVLVHEEDLDRATKLLVESLGYEFKGRGSHDVSIASGSGVSLELHYDLVEKGRANNCSNVLENAWSYAESRDGSSHFEFSDKMFYFYHIAHMAKHFENGGCGIRPYIDLWLLENAVEHSDEDRNSLLEECGLLAFADASRKLSSVWFSDGEHTDLTRALEEFLLNGGVYGNMQNFVAVRHSKLGSKFKYVFHRLFLPYDILSQSYPILKKHRWLTPVMEIVRIVKVILPGKFMRSMKEINTVSNISEKDVQSTSELIQQLGIDKIDI